MYVVCYGNGNGNGNVSGNRTEIYKFSQAILVNGTLKPTHHFDFWIAQKQMRQFNLQVGDNMNSICVLWKRASVSARVNNVPWNT